MPLTINKPNTSLWKKITKPFNAFHYLLDNFYSVIIILVILGLLKTTPDYFAFLTLFVICYYVKEITEAVIRSHKK